MKTITFLGSGVKLLSLSLSLSLLFLISTFSEVRGQSVQDITCDFTGNSSGPEVEWFCDSVFSHSTDPTYLEIFSPIVINIHFWRIVQDNGNPGLGHIDKNDALRMIAEINRELNQYNIFFKYRGFQRYS